MKRLNGLISSIVIGQIRGILNRASHETRINFAISLLAGDIRAQSGLEDWRLLKRIYDRFMKSYPVQPSIESLRTYGFFKIIGGLHDVPGDIVECGVGRARYLVVFAYANKFFNLGRTVYGFDTFSGFPKAHKNDIGLRVKAEGEISGWENCSPEIAHVVMQAERLAEESVLDGSEGLPVIVPGLFRDTLPSHLPEKIAFLHADSDLYESTRDILLNALPRMSSGGWIIFDELHQPQIWPGVKQALDEVCTPRGLRPEWVPELNRLGIRLPGKDLI